MSNLIGCSPVLLLPGFTVTAILMNGSPSSATASLPAMNAGDVVAALTTTTVPAGRTQHTPITLGGPDASSFAITNGGVIPCNLVVGGSNIAAGTYNISLSVT